MVDSLAAVLVGLEQVSIGTGAEVRSLRVGTLLRAESRRKAFVQVLAGETIVGEFFTRWADADGSKRSLLTAISTLSVLV